MKVGPRTGSTGATHLLFALTIEGNGSQRRGRNRADSETVICLYVISDFPLINVAIKQLVEDSL